MTSSKFIAPKSVAEYITDQLEACGKTQYEVAREAGFEKPNVITMIKQGKTKLPLAKVGPMARAIGVDAGFLFMLVLKEYHTETFDQLESFFGKVIPTENEADVVLAMRDAKVGSRKLLPDQKRELLKWLKANIPADS